MKNQLLVLVIRELFNMVKERELPIIEPENEGESKNEMVTPFDPTKINILPKQDSLSNLIERLRNNEIDMNTEFQRNGNLWDVEKMSRFIESILIRFPIPAFYFDASDDANWLIVDGLQRLSSLNEFVVKNNLTLKGLEYLKYLEGFNYEELDRKFIRRINECPITLFILQPGTPDEVKYSIFRRINTGGMVLNNQEIRFTMTSVYLRQFLKDISSNEYLVKTIGDQSKRMLNQEFALRFLAFYYENYNDYTPQNISEFLNEMNEKLKKIEKSYKYENKIKEVNYEVEKINILEKYKIKFHSAMKRCWDIFEEQAFIKKNQEGEVKRKRISPTLFEVWSVALAKISEEEFKILFEKKDILIKKHDKMVTEDDEYYKSLTLSTGSREHVKTRHEKVKELIEEILND